MAGLIVKKLKTLAVGTSVSLTCWAGDNQRTALQGTVTDNDFEESLELTTDSGEVLFLSYEEVLTFKQLFGPGPESGSAQKQAPSAPRQEPNPQESAKMPEGLMPWATLAARVLNFSDSDLKRLFDSLPKEDRKKLNRRYDSFQAGIKGSDRGKQALAARQALQEMKDAARDGYEWNRESFRFCGLMAQRAGQCGAEVFQMGRHFPEAAMSCGRASDFGKAGAFALAALLEGPEPQLVPGLLDLLGASSVFCGDSSAAGVLLRRKPQNWEPWLRTFGAYLLHKKNMVAGVETAEALTARLGGLYPETGIGPQAEIFLAEAAPAPETASDPNPAAEAPQRQFGQIQKLRWADHTGTIVGWDGALFRFRSDAISDKALRTLVEQSLQSDLGGEECHVSFLPEGEEARDIRREKAPLALALEAEQSYRYDQALEHYCNAVSSGPAAQALTGALRCAEELSKQGGIQGVQALQTAMELYRANCSHYPQDATNLSLLARIFRRTGQNDQALELTRQAMSMENLPVKLQATLLAQYVRFCIEMYNEDSNPERMEDLLPAAKAWLDLFRLPELAADSACCKQYPRILQRQFRAACVLERLETAETSYEALCQAGCGAGEQAQMQQTLAQLRRNLTPPEPEPLPEPEESPEEPPENPQTEPAQEEPAPPEGEPEEEEDAPPYCDNAGFDALGLTARDVIDYALNLSGADAVPVMLTYLRSGSLLNPAVTPVYRVAALAGNDPMEAPVYTVTALTEALDASDPDYGRFTDLCMASAFLRASFQAGPGFDYSALGLRSSIGALRQRTALTDVCDLLESFRTAAGSGIDGYADYRSQGVRQLEAELEALSRRGQELYTRFVRTVPRDPAFVRAAETRKLIFAPDGFLAQLLLAVSEGDGALLEERKEEFAGRFLDGTRQFSPRHISAGQVDELIARCYDQAGRKDGSSLQGSRRNSLRTNIQEVLKLLCQWYELSEQNAGLTGRTPAGEDAYGRYQPLLAEALETLLADCRALSHTAPDAQTAAGARLLSDTAEELAAKLDGSWDRVREQYRFATFLQTDNLLLGEDFLPELDGTFCALPEFNLLARIRRHAESEKLPLQTRLEQIYGPNRTHGNYGTARQILAFLQDTAPAEAAALPENPEQFASQAQLQAQLLLRSFREQYALDRSYGKIIQSDDFCYTLEDTVQHWYARCRRSENYGFFTRLVHQGEEQICRSARQYEAELSGQMDALIAGNQAQFDQHPGYEEALRAQIAQQNFSVAEDWMHRIRLGDFSLEVQQPEAIGYLERFWSAYPATSKRVADAGKPLQSLLGRRVVRNRDVKGAQQLIDCWLSNGNPSTPERIGQLLNLLGWQNLQVASCPDMAQGRGEWYRAVRERPVTGAANPQHPIAAFGSSIYRDGMYVVCLYGSCGCDRLMEQIRAMDGIVGSKLILLDYALTSTDRRMLARRLKQREAGLRNVYLVIDRVLICHLSDCYSESAVNRMLMAIGMPFSYCQPYVADSTQTMPPEIFIGRKDELLKIEQPDGVNLIYGGRQLGKSALFKKARADLDGDQGRRAVLVDIKDLDCAQAAWKLSGELADLGIVPDLPQTEDWSVLCRAIRQKLRQDESLRYLLLMLDEADTFIADCAGCSYRPLVELKDVQQALPGRFKFVLAGLHNIVRFNREVALGRNGVITHLPSLKITPFRTPEATELLTLPLSYLGFSLPSKVTVTQILVTANYFPGLIQLYCQKLIASIRAADYAGYDVRRTPPYIITDDHLRRVMADREFTDQIREKFEITLRLDQDQGNCYYPLALLIGWMYTIDASTEGYTPAQVHHQACDLGIGPLAKLDVEQVEALMQDLQDLNVLRSVGRDTYLLSSKNFRDLLGTDEEIYNKLIQFTEVAP